MEPKDHKKIEFGDFQTPDELAGAVVRVLKSRGLRPASIVEPTCGEGSFLLAALRGFATAREAVGLEIDPRYFKKAHTRVVELGPQATVDLRQADFFRFDWAAVFARLPEPILVIGNPPWVTASQLGTLKSKNLPKKSNFQNRRGFDAITGKANFDIAEWMLIHLLEWLAERRGTIAMLLKTTVARKALLHAWKQSLPLSDASIYRIDARRHFGVGVDACLLVCDLRPGAATTKCKVYELDSASRLNHTIGYHRGLLLANVEALCRHESLLQESVANCMYRWRSGVKHDCARVMELAEENGQLTNGLGEQVCIEQEFLYPMLKGSGVANGGSPKAKRHMIVTQKTTGESTEQIKHSAPKTWAYLRRHATLLDARSSSIYRNRPRFSVFGVGPYTFARWKVAICGLYKRLSFSLVGPRGASPTVFDDTVYFIPCLSREEAERVHALLQTPAAQEFLKAFIFWDAKRPITAEILGRLDFARLAREAGQLEELLALRPDLRSRTATAKTAGRLF